MGPAIAFYWQNDICSLLFSNTNYCPGGGTKKSLEAAKLGVDFYPSYETSKFLANCDVVVIAVPLTAVKDTMRSLPVDLLRGKLLVEAGPLNAHPKKVMVDTFGDYPDIDLITANPMFGNDCNGQSGGGDVGDEEKDPYRYTATTTTTTLEGRPMIYEKIRIANVPRCEAFFDLFKDMRCQLIEMNAEQHDQSVGDAEFVTHLIGRLLVEKQLLPPTPVVSKEYAALCDVAEMTAGDSFDLFFGMYKYNQDRAKGHLVKLRDNLANIERQLVAKESYLEATAELHNQDRQRLLAETKSLLQEILTSGGLVVPAATTTVAATAVPPETAVAVAAATATPSRREGAPKRPAPPVQEQK
jgi:arogenate dehydrogenase (NADP+), plant